MESSKGFGPKRRPKMVPRCQKCNADRMKVIIVRNCVGHVTDLELDVSGALSQCPSGDPAQQVQSSSEFRYFWWPIDHFGGWSFYPKQNMVSYSLKFTLSIWSFRARSRAIILVGGKLDEILTKMIILVGDHFSGKALYGAFITVISPLFRFPFELPSAHWRPVPKIKTCNTALDYVISRSQ